MRFAVQIVVGMLLAAVAAAPSLSSAATISSITIVKNAGNTADFFDNTGNTSAVQSTATVTASTSTTLDTRYAWFRRPRRRPPTRTRLHGDFSSRSRDGESQHAWFLTRRDADRNRRSSALGERPRRLGALREPRLGRDRAQRTWAGALTRRQSARRPAL